jgi:hypothetical protein
MHLSSGDCERERRFLPIAPLQLIQDPIDDFGIGMRDLNVVVHYASFDE